MMKTLFRERLAYEKVGIRLNQSVLAAVRGCSAAEEYRPSSQGKTPYQIYPDVSGTDKFPMHVSS